MTDKFAYNVKDALSRGGSVSARMYFDGKITMSICRYINISVLALLPLLALQAHYSFAATDNNLELTPIIYDDPSSLILPAAFFVRPDRGILIIDAGSNSARINFYSEEGQLLDARLPAYSADVSTTPALPGFNPFAKTSWSYDGNGTVLILEHHPGGQVLRGVSREKMWDRDLSPETGFRLTTRSGETPLFDQTGLFNIDGERIKTLNLEGYEKVTFDENGDIYALSEHGLAKFNSYGIPRWTREFPDTEEGSFLPISFAAAGPSIVVAGIVLPSGLDIYEFLVNYEAAYASNPDLSPAEILDLFDYLAGSGTPLLLKYSTLDGELVAGMELSACPIWVDALSEGEIYLLNLDSGQARITRVSPDFSEDLTIFETECGKRSLEGVSKIILAGGYIYHDISENEVAEDGIYRDKISIIRRPLDAPGETEVFATKPQYEGGYLVAGLASGNDTIYLAGAKFSFSPGGEVTPGGPFLDAYDSNGALVLNFLDGADPGIIPNALACGIENDILLAITNESGALSTSWALRFSSDGHLLGEFFYLGPGGVNEINMVAGGTIGVTSDGTIYQCDNLRPPDPDEPYMRKFNKKGKFIEDLRKFSLINSGLAGIVDDHPIMLWRNRYLFKLEDDHVIAQADLGNHFETTKVDEIASDGESLYILATDGVIYEASLDYGWDTESFLTSDIESAAETYRAILLTYSTNHGFLPDKLADEFWETYSGDVAIDELAELFFGAGPFDYETNGRFDFSFRLFGRDSYQTVYLVTRDEVTELY